MTFWPYFSHDDGQWMILFFPTPKMSQRCLRTKTTPAVISSIHIVPLPTPRTTADGNDISVARRCEEDALFHHCCSGFAVYFFFRHQPPLAHVTLWLGRDIKGCPSFTATTCRFTRTRPIWRSSVACFQIFTGMSNTLWRRARYIIYYAVRTVDSGLR